MKGIYLTYHPHEELTPVTDEVPFDEKNTLLMLVNLR